jgi:glycerol-3-phosphate acyltransferase PlsY
MLVIIVAYIIGAIPGGYLVSRILQYTEAKRNMPPAEADYAIRFKRISTALGSILADAAKGMLVVWLVPKLAGYADTPEWRWLIYPFISMGLLRAAVLVIAVFGHVLSVYICGWGGKGTAVTLGGFIVLAPKITLCALALFVPIAGVTRTIIYASLIACCSLPVLFILFARDEVPLLVASIILALLSVITHYRDMKRRRDDVSKH